MSDEPYNMGTRRLVDVLAAIQFLGTYRFYKISLESWRKRIKFEPKSEVPWERLFSDHPEFFRISTYEEDEDDNEGVDDDDVTSKDKRVCLVLRRARPKNFNVDTGETVTRDERKALSEKERRRISRAPLEPSDLSVLLNAAIELHGRYIAHQEARRWFVPLVASLSGTIGAIVGAIIVAIFGRG